MINGHKPCATSILGEINRILAKIVFGAIFLIIGFYYIAGNIMP